MHLYILPLFLGTLCVFFRNSIMASQIDFKFSIEDDLKALNEWGQAITDIWEGRIKVCPVVNVGTGYGLHTLCDYPPKNTQRQMQVCKFLSFGISTDYSFDTDMYKRFGCTGIALDPSITYPLNFTDGVHFYKAGANSVGEHPADWIMYSVPKLRLWLDHPLYALKMDCEGCEFVLARDILDHEPKFFDYVFQFNIEVHTPKPIMTLNEYSYDLGRLYRLLALSGLQLQQWDEGTCDRWMLRKGYQQLLIDSKFPQYPGCQSFLFARPNVTYTNWLRHLNKEAKERGYADKNTDP